MLLVALFVALVQTAHDPRVVEMAPAAPATAMVPGTLPNRPKDGEQLICRTESVVGSNRRQRVCMSAAQRDALRAQSTNLREGLDQMLTPRMEAPTGG